jgi:ATP adenylyltransferase
MERLWSPWRMEYIRSARPEEEPACIFCELPEKGDDEAALIVARGDRAFVLLNAFPYNAGHLMVAPFRHAGRLGDLEDDELLDMDHLLQRSVGALREVAQPDGFNLGMNLGQVAGAGIPDHLHWHVVPRWSGDTNFMPVVGETKVLPELLAESYAKLTAAFPPGSGDA